MPQAVFLEATLILWLCWTDRRTWSLPSAHSLPTRVWWMRLSASKLVRNLCSSSISSFKYAHPFTPAHVEVDPQTVNPPPNGLPSPSASLHFNAPPKKRRIQLQSASDPLFAELRDKNFAVVGGTLNRVAHRINADYESRHAAMQGSVSQMRNFVGRLQGLQAEHQALRVHTALTDQVMQTTMGEEFNQALEIQQSKPLLASAFSKPHDSH